MGLHWGDDLVPTRCEVWRLTGARVAILEYDRPPRYEPGQKLASVIAERLAADAALAEQRPAAQRDSGASPISPAVWFEATHRALRGELSVTARGYFLDWQYVAPLPLARA